jgi:CubicO group peptidase (beta-lactamase class C family)
MKMQFLSRRRFLAAAGSGAALWASPKAPSDFSEIDQFLEKAPPRMSGGCALILIQDGEVIYRKAFGNFHTPEHVVPVASSTKWLSGGVIMSLVDEGKLSLDDTASKFLPKFTGKKGGITIRQMFSHTHGFEEQPAIHRNTKITLEQAADLIAGVPLTADPGTALIYSGLGMQVAGRIAEIVSGKAWVDLFEEKLAGPLGMNNTDYYAFGETKNPNVAGSVKTNVDDYGAYVTMIANKGVHKGKRVLSESAVATMLRNQSGNVPIKRHPWSPLKEIDPEIAQAPYGIGCWLEKWDRKTGKAWDASSGGAFGCDPWVDLRRNLAAVFLPYSRVMRRGAGGLVYNEAHIVYLELKKRLRALIPEKGRGWNT